MTNTHYSDGVVGFLAGRVVEHVWRHEHKEDAVQDLEKAKWYLERLIKYQRDGK